MSLPPRSYSSPKPAPPMAGVVFFGRANMVTLVLHPWSPASPSAAQHCCWAPRADPAASLGLLGPSSIHMHCGTWQVTLSGVGESGASTVLVLAALVGVLEPPGPALLAILLRGAWLAVECSPSQLGSGFGQCTLPPHALLCFFFPCGVFEPFCVQGSEKSFALPPCSTEHN